MTRRNWIGAAAASPLLAQGEPKFELINVKVEPAEYKGRKGWHITPAAQAGERQVALLAGSKFRNGAIEVELSGAPGAAAVEGARGFVGVAFRVQPGAERFECFYIRPTNGRADDQVRRNHSTQYVSHPEFPWPRLRKETPEKYESYVDLEPGVWTKIRIEVSGVKARLFVHGAAQPCLIVNDLKLGDSEGAVGVWVGPGTDGHFTGLRITPA
jgi:hypothetical protein